jgi:tagaturonate reductase
LAFYRGERQAGSYALQDDAHWLTRFATLWAGVEHHDLTLAALVESVLADEAHWGQNLNAVPGLTVAVTTDLQAILDHGMRAALSEIERR